MLMLSSLSVRGIDGLRQACLALVRAAGRPSHRCAGITAGHENRGCLGTVATLVLIGTTLQPLTLLADGERNEGAQYVATSTLATSLGAAVVEQALPRVMSTNICADTLLLGLADGSQLVSLSRQAVDPRRSSLAYEAKRFPTNQASAEEVIMQQPDIVLASRRWQAQHQSKLFERFGIMVVNVPFPKDWEEIFSTLLQIGELIGRRERAEQLVSQTRERLARIQPPTNANSVLYLRGNGGTAASGTYIDALTSGLGVSNQATVYGLEGWSRVSLESILLSPPGAFLLSQTRHDASPARSGVTRHPLLRQQLIARPVVSLNSLDNACSNWRQIETVERLAGLLSEPISTVSSEVAQ